MSEGQKDRESMSERFGGIEEHENEKMDACIMKVAQTALPANVLEIITRLSKMQDKIDREFEKINDKLDTIIRRIGVNET